MAEFKVAKNAQVMEAIGVGSCVIVTLYDDAQKIGGMAHIMLPKFEGKGEVRADNIGKYADCAIPAMLNQIIALGAKKNCVKAKVFGGADMFSDIGGRSKTRIGEKNVQAVHEELKRCGLRLSAQETGGDEGRTVTFDLSDGRVSIRSVRSGARFY